MATTDPRVVALQQQAAFLKAQNDVQEQQQRALLLNPVPTRPKVSTPEPIKWAQDLMDRPYNSSNAHEDAFLKSFDRMNVSFPFQYNVTSAGGQFIFVVQVELTRNLWISNVVASGFNTATQAIQNQKAGYVSLYDNATNNCFFSNVQLNFLATQILQPAVRSILPRPYPIGAGGSCNIVVNVPNTPSLSTYDAEIRVEGFWDFSHVS